MTWAENRAAGKCGQCGKRKPLSGKTRCAVCVETVRVGYRNWAVNHRDEDQARKNEWAKSEVGQAWLKVNQTKKNERRKAWRIAQRKAGKKVS